MPKTPVPTPVSTGFWLLKSEPDVFSWDMLVAKGEAGEPWTGVRNYQARNNMRAMQLGDRGFFYHSNIGKEIVGILEVAASAHADPDDDSGTWECVDVRAVMPLPRFVTLAEARAEPLLAGMPLVSNSRLSVQPVSTAHWSVLCELAGLSTAPAAVPAQAKMPRRKS
jgi:predicted RNA-binding protein with PUA-like domain